MANMVQYSLIHVEWDETELSANYNFSGSQMRPIMQ